MEPNMGAVLEDLKQWAYENRKGLIVGAVIGFIASRILK